MPLHTAPDMQPLRAFLVSHRRWAALLLAVALAMRALVPAGYMVGGDSAQTLTVQICADSLAQIAAKQITIPLSGQHDPGHDAHGDSPCHFTALGHAVLGGADPILLALALLFIVALGLVDWTAPPLRLARHLRPPLRGPPTIA